MGRERRRKEDTKINEEQKKGGNGGVLRDTVVCTLASTCWAQW
jgi:hypothetical protein